jgi:DSF synthase
MSPASDSRQFALPALNLVETRLDWERGVYWAFMQSPVRPCFTPAMLADLTRYVDSIQDGGGRFADQDGVSCTVNYAVIASGVPGIFSLGGDLELFKGAIARRERTALVHYGRQCVDTLFRWWQNCSLPLSTISLVQGDALGGGFECALASTFVVAEESARMGFPEVLFNLFPGMGAYSFLIRKIGRKLTEELVSSGATYSARQLHEMGVVDVVAPDGSGEAAVATFIATHSRSSNGRRGIEAVAREVQPLKHEELVRIVDIWADAALRLGDRDLKLMERLLRAQTRRQGTSIAPTTAFGNVVPIAPVAAPNLVAAD